MQKLIVVYGLEYDRPSNSYPVECCGAFDDYEHFLRFKKLEESKGKRVSNVQVIGNKEVDLT